MAERPSIPLNEADRQQQGPLKRQMADTASIPESSRPLKKRKPPKNHSLLESMPPEVFCKVLTFVGPASDSLIALSETSKYMNNAMTGIGNVMLPRAQSNFRVPLQPKSPNESCISLLIRHSRRSATILDQLSQLRQLISQPDTDVANTKQAMSIALCLLQSGPTLSMPLERQILSTCGKCGGKAFKFNKRMLLQDQSQPTSDNSPPALQERQSTHSKNQERLDMSQLIMQTVVFRNLQLAKESTLNSTRLVQNQQNVKTAPSMGCFKLQQD